MKTLAKEIPNLTVLKAGPVFTMEAADQSGWELVTGTTNSFINQTFFDLAGMSQREKTLFFEAAALQEVLAPFATAATAGDTIIVTDIMSTQQLRPNEALAFSAQGNFADSGSSLNYEQTIYGRVRIFNVDLDNAAGGYYITLADNQMGSLQATASDRIYCTRVVSFGTGNSNGNHGVSYARYLLRANAREEAEYQYLMRLRRSYELQQTYDED